MLIHDTCVSCVHLTRRASTLVPVCSARKMAVRRSSRRSGSTSVMMLLDSSPPTWRRNRPALSDRCTTFDSLSMITLGGEYISSAR